MERDDETSPFPLEREKEDTSPFPLSRGKSAENERPRELDGGGPGVEHEDGIAYRVEEPRETTHKAVSYSDNFKFTRQGQWTH